MKKMLAVLLTESCESWSDQNELNCIKKITFPRAISSNDHIVFGAMELVSGEASRGRRKGPEWDDLLIALVPEAPEARDDQLLDVHSPRETRDKRAVGDPTYTAPPTQFSLA
jgi:hypothetical protein